MDSGARKRKFRLHAGYYNSIRGLCLAGLSFRHREERSDAAVCLLFLKGRLPRPFRIF